VLSVYFYFAIPESTSKKDLKPLTRQEKIDLYKKYKAIPFDFDSLQTGDLVLRTGLSFFSDELRKFSQREAKYSHCGIVSRDEEGKIFIYHSIGGTDNPESRVRKDSVFSFFNPFFNSGFAIYRYNLTPQQIKTADSLAKDLYKREVKFDLNFDLDDDENLYCAEFIYKILIKATNTENFISLSQIKGKAYVGIDDLYLNENCKNIFEYEYY